MGRIFQRYNRNPNYVAYIVIGQNHTFTETPYFYTASAEGWASRGEPMMYAWVGQFVSGDAATVSTVCSGTVMEATDKHVDYCDVQLMNKVLSPASTCTLV